MPPRARAMNFYSNHLYPALVTQLGNPAPVRVLRARLMPRARGIVLEIGVGAGANFPYYDLSKIAMVYALEPNPGMRRRAELHRPAGLQVEFLSLPGERLPLPDVSVDTVVSTFTLCTISGLDDALRELARVLKPGGALILLENSLAQDRRIQRWQRRWEPVFHWIFEGLLLTRDLPALVADAGFRTDSISRAYLSPFPKSWSHCCWGIAVRE